MAKLVDPEFDTDLVFKPIAFWNALGGGQASDRSGVASIADLLVNLNALHYWADVRRSTFEEGESPRHVARAMEVSTTRLYRFIFGVAGNRNSPELFAARAS